MCGIAGTFDFRDRAPVSPERVRAMCRVIRHRGPDDEGIYVDGPLGLGMRRLSIIDLSTGQQPIHNEDESVWVVFNGEIYNFPELRRSLEAKGHVFYTQTDTEVIVHLYEDFGEGFVDRLTGMFAIALWDRRKRKLLLARDRLGIKPLYYHAGPNRLVFGSEIKCLLEGGVDREVDLQALHDYLSLNYIPGPRSIFRHIRKLPPGHLLVCADGNVSVRSYWDVPYPASTDGGTKRTEASFCEELHELLRTVVSQHLLSDVPLGVFLSGGVDSGSLVALMSEVSSQRIQSFSIGFDDPSYNELEEARAVAQRYGTNHHEMVVKPDAVELIPDLVRFFDEPFADSSAVPVYCVAKLARQHVTVALSGEGGDEVFAGYETYGAYKFAELYKQLPSLLATKLVPAVVKSLPVSHRRVSFDYKAKRFVDGALLPPADGHYWWKVIFSEDAKEALYAGGRNGFVDPLQIFRDAYDGCSAPDPLTKLQHIDLKCYLPDDILVKADRMSMANSLEVRVPFLDHRVVEFAAGLPPSMKVHGFTRKYILKRTMAPYLPARNWRAKKRGFNVPIAGWINHELRDLTHDVLSPRRVREAGYFDPAYVSSMLSDHENRRVDLSRNIWGLLLFALWHDEYVRAPRS